MSDLDAWGLHVVSSLVMHYPLRKLELPLSFDQLSIIPELSKGLLLPLEYLKLETDADDDMNVLLFPPDLRVPKLKSIFIIGNLDIRGIFSAAPWKQICNFHLDTLTNPSFCLDILRQCHSLITCHLYVDSEAEITNPNDEIILPNLQTLYIRFHDDGDANPFQRLLTLPCVTSINFECFYDPILCDPLLLSKMIHRSNDMPSLTTLSISRSETPIDLGRLLQDAPSLEELSVTNGRLNNKARLGIAMGTLGPRLQKIFSNLEHEANGILCMVESRQQNVKMGLLADTHVSLLKYVSVKCRKVIDGALPALQTRIHKLQKAGVDVQVFSM
ncbi:hypothetical protein AMATHDRAFT_923 [Amanita thiersii Skay4041]|uniref:F-box domain-containing protein n=1 Tax=Amanita thiersii Skay4041 TaxID=703135 RepID=A0A2A9NZU7_9AGAR|nr:hypothetical protein AMATHDRAFT_923 [Amanita thiersii Skay4041]